MAVQLHQLAGVLQYVVFGIAAALVLFFLVEAMRKRRVWEVLFANTALATFYMLERRWGLSGPVHVSRYGSQVPWFRYVEWLLTFPTLLVAVANLTALGRRKWGPGVTALGTFQVALLAGITAAYCSGTTAKIVFAAIAAAAFVFVLALTSLIFRMTSREVPHHLRGLSSLLQILLLLTWLAYPVIWAIGPEGFHRISFDGETVAFAVTDIFAKCAWSLLLWFFRRTVRASVPAEFWATHSDAKTFPGALGDRGSAQQLLAKHDPVLLPGRRFQPALPDSKDETTMTSPYGIARTQPEAIARVGWPLGLSRALEHIASKREPRTSPRFWFPGLSDQIATEQAAQSPVGTPFPVAQVPAVVPSPRQEVEPEGFVMFDNPLAGAETEALADAAALPRARECSPADVATMRPMRAAADAAALPRARELAIDIPLVVAPPVWAEAASTEERKRTWAGYIRSLGGRDSPPGSKSGESSEEGEEELGDRKMLKRASPTGIYSGAGKSPEDPSPVSVLAVDPPREAVPVPDPETPRARLERIPEASESSDVNSPAKVTSPFAVKVTSASPATMTTKVPVEVTLSSPPKVTSAFVERSAPRSAPRRRPLPFLDEQTGRLNRGVPGYSDEEEAPVPDAPETPPVVPTGKPDSTTGESDVDTFDSEGTPWEESISSGSAGGVTPRSVNPLFSFAPGGRFVPKPDAGSPPVDALRALFPASQSHFAPPVNPPNIRYSPPQSVSETAPSKAPAPALAGEAFDAERVVLLARPARRRTSDVDPRSCRSLGEVWGREGLEVSAASGSPHDENGNGLSRSVSAGNLEGGGISVSFDAPQRRTSGAFAFWDESPKPADARSDDSEREITEFWDAKTGTPSTPQSEASENAASTTIDVDAPQSDTWPTDNLGDPLQPARLQGLQLEESGNLWERSFREGLVDWNFENDAQGDFRRRSFPVPVARTWRDSTKVEIVRRSFVGYPVDPRELSPGASADGPSGTSQQQTERLSVPAFDKHPVVEQSSRGEVTQARSESQTLRVREDGGRNENGAVELRVSGIRGEESGQPTGRRIRRPWGPMTLPQLRTAPVVLEPIVEASTPVTSPDAEKLRTAIRFYSPQLRRSIH